jgi:hypothetical protein
VLKVLIQFIFTLYRCVLLSSICRNKKKTNQQMTLHTNFRVWDEDILINLTHTYTLTTKAQYKLNTSTSAADCSYHTFKCLLGHFLFSIYDQAIVRKIVLTVASCCCCHCNSLSNECFLKLFGIGC